MKAIVDATLYDRGTAEVPEDGMWPNFPIIGVWDGVSAPFSPSNPPAYYAGLTGGQMVSRLIQDTLAEINGRDIKIEEAVKLANQRISRFFKKEKLDLSDASKLGAATFAFAKIGNEKVEIVQGGDCYALWVMKSGEFGITHNYFLPIELHLRKTIAKLMREKRGSRRQMWDEFYPMLCASRRNNTNIPDGCIVLNGQPAVEKLWQKIDLNTNDLSLLVLFTDGLIHPSLAGDEKELGKRLIELYEQDRLIGILEWARALEAERADESHETFSEATGIAISFK